MTNVYPLYRVLSWDFHDVLKYTSDNYIVTLVVHEDTVTMIVKGFTGDIRENDFVVRVLERDGLFFVTTFRVVGAGSLKTIENYDDLTYDSARYVLIHIFKDFRE